MPYDAYHITEIEATYPSKEEAEKISFNLLEEKVIACATLTEVVSISPWEGRLDKSSEIKFNIKTLDKYADQVKEIILARHSYEIPMVLTTAER